MKKKIGILLAAFLMAFVFTGCDEILSVVTAGENGEKIVNNYVSMITDTVYDETATIKSWRDIDTFDNEVKMEDLLFRIENKKENLVVFGDKDAAVEISFFDGGYKYKLFASMEQINNMFKN